MPPASLETSFPLSITILSFIATGALVAILVLLIVINSKLSALAAKLSRSSRATKPESREPAQGNTHTPDAAESQDEVEVPSGTHFEEFLKEDPERRKLTKKEKFKAYRAWRTEKGLNWKP